MNITKKIFFILFSYFILFSLIFGVYSCSRPEYTFSSDELLDISFDPKHTQKLVLDLIQQSRKSIYVSLYGLDNELITEALINAYKRGIDVQLSSDFDSEPSPSWQHLLENKLPVSFGNSSGIMHNKYWLFDGKIIVTGSLNFSQRMFKNYNNSVVISSPKLVSEYLRDFKIQRSGSYGGRKDSSFKIIESVDSFFSWVPSFIQLNDSMKVSVWFTPYRSTISFYGENSNNYPDCSLSCMISDDNKCNLKASLNCFDMACYNKSKKEIIYRYQNYEKKYETCAKFKHAFNTILPLIERAKKRILVLAFSFRDKVFMDRLIRAAQSGVQTEIYIDYRQYLSAYKNTITSLRATALGVSKNGFLKVTQRLNRGSMHHKVIVVDQKTVLLGSLNFSQSAVNSNDENFLIFENADLLAWEFYQEATRIDKESSLLSSLESFKNY